MKKTLVLQSDFGLVDGAVSAMEGVAFRVDDSLRIRNLTHDITAYNIFEASYRLFQTVEYWSEGTVFVSVVDPGVGSQRKSVVALTNAGHYIVTPDNGTLTHIKKYMGIKAVREISEVTNRRANTGARLASGTISFKKLDLNYQLKELLNYLLLILKLLKTQ